MDAGLRAFAHLKTLVLEQYRQAYPHFQGKLADFRQVDIANLQDLLEQRMRGRISEKWFYTHLKVEENEKLPRVDTLDLLAGFVGYASWEAFCYAQQRQHVNSKRYWILAVLLLGLLGVTAAFRWWPGPEERLKLCFYDALRKTPITDVPVAVSLQSEHYATTLTTKVSEESCITFPQVEQKVVAVCSAPYYHPDTIVVESSRLPISKDIHLRADDYALMIHYLSNSKVTDWKRRRDQLAQIFAEDAIIYQLEPEGLRGMDILNKTDFINRMTIPTKSLRGVEVLGTTYQDGKIIELRFIIQE